MSPMSISAISLGAVTQAILLVALALGYLVCYFANQEEKQLKTVGLLVGSFIMTLSIILIITSVLATYKSSNVRVGKLSSSPQQNNRMRFPKQQKPMSLPPMHQDMEDFDLDELPMPPPSAVPPQRQSTK